MAQLVKYPLAMQETTCNAVVQVQSLGQEDPLEKPMATHSSVLAGKIPGTEEPGGLYFTGSQRVGHDLATKPPPPPSPFRLQQQP